MKGLASVGSVGYTRHLELGEGKVERAYLQVIIGLGVCSFCFLEGEGCWWEGCVISCIEIAGGIHRSGILGKRTVSGIHGRLSVNANG